MPPVGGAPHLSRLGRLARGDRVPARARERCDLCACPVQARHRHLLDVRERRLLCACRACAILFDRGAAGGGHYRLVPDRCRFVTDFGLSDALWERLAIPVELAFFFESTPAGRVVAFYPSPAGATESLLELGTWGEIQNANPVVATMEADVEALLVNRTRGAREHWLTPVDECYRLVGLVRVRWRGLSGGEEVWSAIADFLREMHERATLVRRDGRPASAPSNLSNVHTEEET